MQCVWLIERLQRLTNELSCRWLSRQWARLAGSGPHPGRFAGAVRERDLAAAHPQPL